MSSGKLRSKAANVKFKDKGDHDPSECGHKLYGQYIHHKPAKATEGKDLVKQGSRQLIVPSRNPIDVPKIVPQSEFTRLKNQAHVVTTKDRLAIIDEVNRRKLQLQKESQERKEMMQQCFQQNVNPESKLSKIEDEAKSKNQYLLKRAHDLRQEQEDEVKKANAVILATKCRAIRNAQIREKELIQKQLEEEEKRLDMMMEQSRLRAIRAEEMKKELQEQKNSKYVKEVTEQIKERELQRLLEAERKEEESKLINKALIATQKEEEEKMRKKQEDNLKLREELHKANIELEHYKMLQKEEEKIAEMRVQEFMRKKAEREQAREEEQKAIREAKEKEIARLRSQQEKAADQQAMFEEMNARRVQEEVERAWRIKEIEQARKKKEELRQLHLAREKQIEDIRRAQAIELARDEQEFHQVAKIQAKQHEQEMEKRQKKKEQAVCLREELLKQVNEKEKERIRAVQEKFEEGNALKLEKELRDLRIREYIGEKMDKLRENNVPEAYVKDIQRHLKSHK